MHPTLQEIVSGKKVETVSEWEAAVPLLIESRIPSLILLTRSEIRAGRFISEVLDYSVLDVLLNASALTLDIDLATSEVWQEKTRTLTALQSRAEQVCLWFSWESFLSQLEKHLAGLGLADPE